MCVCVRACVRACVRVYKKAECLKPLTKLIKPPCRQKLQEGHKDLEAVLVHVHFDLISLRDFWKRDKLF